MQIYQTKFFFYVCPSRNWLIESNLIQSILHCVTNELKGWQNGFRITKAVLKIGRSWQKQILSKNNSFRFCQILFSPNSIFAKFHFRSIRLFPNSVLLTFTIIPFSPSLPNTLKIQCLVKLPTLVIQRP